jgi:hypothetical protein
LAEGFWPALGRETHLEVDLPVRGARSEQRGELVHVPAGDGWVLFGGVLAKIWVEHMLSIAC